MEWCPFRCATRLCPWSYIFPLCCTLMTYHKYWITTVFCLPMTQQCDTWWWYFRMQQDINNLVMWSEKWQLPFNVLDVQLYILERQTVVICIPWLVFTNSRSYVLVKFQQTVDYNPQVLLFTYLLDVAARRCLGMINKCFIDLSPQSFTYL